MSRVAVAAGGCSASWLRSGPAAEPPGLRPERLFAARPAAPAGRVAASRGGRLRRRERPAAAWRTPHWPAVVAAWRTPGTEGA